MEQVMSMVSKEAKDVLLDWQKRRGFNRQDVALQDLLITFKQMLVDDEQGYQQDAVAQIEHENKEPEEE